EAEAVIHGSIALCKPLENEDGPLGWLCLGGPEPSTEEHLLAEELARRVSRALVAAHTVVNRSQTFRTLERSLLPDALLPLPGLQLASRYLPATGSHDVGGDFYRSEEHTSELQSPYDLVCRLLLEKKKASAQHG